MENLEKRINTLQSLINEYDAEISKIRLLVNNKVSTTNDIDSDLVAIDKRHEELRRKVQIAKDNKHI